MQQLDFAARPETCEKRRRERVRLAPREPELTEKRQKCEGLTEVGRRAGLVGFRELYYHLEDTERKWSALSNASSVLF